ncbi:MAG: 16S rRNA (cytidine(1402)-2'-O)-methyltransferase [Candidatus Niyogibacteria bacterium]|nr:16S rRNA (cytidine(1402)-2'-O)-methyltransferase [Candidatus Niyogibacteria bacterium]
MPILYVIATPIGNLKDITLRALEVLRAVDFIICEDTRVTRKLLAHYQISKPLVSYHQYSKLKSCQKIADFLKTGKSAALVSDAGTPGISDPGARLIDFIRRELPAVRLIAVPGPSALIAAASVSGINTDKFLFLGFPPRKKGRQKFFKRIQESVEPVIFYESTHRVAKAFAELAAVLGDTAEIAVAREITKIYEEIWRGVLKDAAAHFINERQRGEFVIIIP